MKYIQSGGGYYYKQYQNGGKKRISKTDYVKVMKGGFGLDDKEKNALYIYQNDNLYPFDISLKLPSTNQRLNYFYENRNNKYYFKMDGKLYHRVHCDSWERQKMLTYCCFWYEINTSVLYVYISIKSFGKKNNRKVSLFLNQVKEAINDAIASKSLYYLSMPNNNNRVVVKYGDLINNKLPGRNKYKVVKVNANNRKTAITTIN